MLEDGIIYRSLLHSLSVLGPSNADLIVKMLEEHIIIQNGKSTPTGCGSRLRRYLATEAGSFAPE